MPEPLIPERIPSLHVRDAGYLYSLAGVRLVAWDERPKDATAAELADAASEALVGFMDTAECLKEFIAAKPADLWQERTMRCLLIIVESRCVELRKLL